MNRRSLLQSAAGVAGVAALSGCSAVRGANPPTLDRIVLRSDTGQEEAVLLILVYAPRDDSTAQDFGVYETPASGELKIIGNDHGPGIYSLTAHRQTTESGGLEVGSFNSYGDAVETGTDLQFEVVIKRNGDLWLNLNEAGASISIPGY